MCEVLGFAAKTLGAQSILEGGGGGQDYQQASVRQQPYIIQSVRA